MFPSGYEIAGAEKPPGPEQICRDVSAQFARLEEAGYGSVLRALEWIGVARLHGFEWTPEGCPREHNGRPPADQDGVLIPWWVLSALVGALQRSQRERLPLDDVLGISGTGGGRTLWQRQDDIADKALRATEVRYLIERHKLSLEAASEAVAERHGITPDMVRKNYREVFPKNRPGSRARSAKRN